MLEDSRLGEELWAKAMVTTIYTRNRLPSRAHGKTPWEKLFREKPNPAFGTIELNSRSKKEERAHDLSHVSPPIQMGAGNIPMGKFGTGREESNGPLGVLTQGPTVSQKLLLQIDLKDEEDGKEQELRRNPARGRRTPARYWANLAIEGSNPRGSGEHHELQTYQEVVSREESELWHKSMDEEMRSL
ncbi:unnamed protein product [Sphagnum jensenii]|uniref:Uncharacterized protein n=1 Tax=Sphagnum jensenii TaxID=128206 RepID=A0ABP1AZJ6_9BRYO